MDPFFTERQDRQFTVVEFRTESLMNPRDLEQIGGGLYRLIDEQHRKLLLLDLSNVRYVSSQAIGVLVTLNKKLSQVPGGKLVLCGVGPDIMKLLKITRLDRLLTVRPTQREALEGGFTLVELLVVVGIIAVLIAMLMPALARARDAAMKAACASNLRQLDAAFFMYVNTNRGVFPFSASMHNTPVGVDKPEDWVHWQPKTPGGGVDTSPIATYVAARGPALTALLRCPADVIDNHEVDPQSGKYPYSYSMNGYLDPRDIDGLHVKVNMARVKSASDIVMLVEESEKTINDGHWAAGYYSGKTWTAGWDRLSIRHDRYRSEYDPVTAGVVAQLSRRGNASFCDGHVEFVTREFAHDPMHVVPVH